MSRRHTPHSPLLHLPLPPAGEPSLPRRRRRRPASRWRQAGVGLLFVGVGAAILVGLMQIPERLDTLLLVSNAIANVIAGLSRLGIGLLQLAGVLAVVVLALLALVLLAGGCLRLLRAVSPRSGKAQLPPQRL